MRFYVGASVLLSLVGVSTTFGEVSKSSGFLEHLIQTRWSGTIPFPPEKLVEDLLALSSANDKVYASILSQGRSPERKVTGDDRPRSLFALGTNLYVGYSPQNKELQIISSNPGPPAQYDFDIVSGYGTKDQVIRKANKETECMSCHHDGGPIFPVFPWSETESQLGVSQRGNADAVTKFRMNINLDPFASYLVRKPVDANPHFVLGAAEFEANVLRGDLSYDSMRFCAKLCRGGFECEKMLADIALTPTAKYEELFRMNLASRWEDYAKKTSLADFREASAGFYNIIPDRNPRAPIVGEVDPTTARPKSLSDDPSSFASSPLDAKDPKVMGRQIAEIARRCFPFSDSQRKELDENETRSTRVLASPALREFLRNNWPPLVDDLMTFVRTGTADHPQCVVTAGEPISSMDSSHLEDTRDTVAKIAALDAFKARSPGELFTHYCSECHKGPKVDYPLLLDDPESLAGYVGADTGRTVRMMIDLPNPRMPPTGSPQPDAEERTEMIKSLVPLPSPKF